MIASLYQSGSARGSLKGCAMRLTVGATIATAQSFDSRQSRHPLAALNRGEGGVDSVRRFAGRSQRTGGFQTTVKEDFQIALPWKRFARAAAEALWRAGGSQAKTGLFFL